MFGFRVYDSSNDGDGRQQFAASSVPGVEQNEMEFRQTGRYQRLNTVCLSVYLSVCLSVCLSLNLVLQLHYVLQFEKLAGVASFHFGHRGCMQPNLLVLFAIQAL